MRGPSPSSAHTDLPYIGGDIESFRPVPGMVGVGVGVEVIVGVGVAVADGSTVGVGVGDNVGVFVGDGEGVGLGVLVGDGVGVGVGVGVVLYGTHPKFVISPPDFTYFNPSAISIKEPTTPKTWPLGLPCNGMVLTISNYILIKRLSVVFERRIKSLFFSLLFDALFDNIRRRLIESRCV